ncbi:hypothetical protein EBR21_17655, partial [bacterium]|nr:hypothetical protein [bacterium]
AEPIKIAKPEQELTQPLRLTGFGKDESGYLTKGPVLAVSGPSWKSAESLYGYGIVGFPFGDSGWGCGSDHGAPAASEGFLVGIQHSAAVVRNGSERNPRFPAQCADVTRVVLTDVRRMRGWLKCSANQLGSKLAQVEDAINDPWCSFNQLTQY